MSSAEASMDRHLECFGRRDLDGILADYSSTAVMFTPDGPLKSPAAIRPSCRQSLQNLASLARRYSMKQRCVDGDYAFIIWSAETADKCTRWEPTPLSCGTAR